MERSHLLVDDRGTGPIEGAILASVFIAVMAAGVITGRYSDAADAVDLAAHDAARAASLERGATDATERANAVAEAALENLCDTYSVEVDASEFALPVGQPATVTVTATCHIDFEVFALPGMPNAVEPSATYASPIDTWRSRT